MFPPFFISRMTQQIQRGELVSLAQSESNGNALTIQVLRAGDFVDMHGKSCPITSADLDVYVDNSNALLATEQVPVEIGHPDDAGAPAAAWYKRFFKKVVSGVEWICAEIELTTVGSDALTKKLYKYFSANVDLAGKTLRGGGFVNRPAVTGQEVIGSISLAAYLHPKEPRMKLSQTLQSAYEQLRRTLGLVQLEMSQEETQQKLWDALRAKYADPLDEYGMSMPWLKATYDDHVIVEKSGECFSISYSLDGDTVTLGDPVPVEIVYQPKDTSTGTAALSRPPKQGGETTMTKEQEIELARKEEREKAELAATKHQEELRLAREDERKRVLAEQTRANDVRQLAAKLTSGKKAFPQKPADLEALLLKLSDDDRALITPLLEQIQLSGLVDLGEIGHNRDEGGKKPLDSYMQRQLSNWTGAGKTVAEFFSTNPELGKAEEYDLSAFEPKK